MCGPGAAEGGARRGCCSQDAGLRSTVGTSLLRDGERSGLVTAHPVDDHDPDDPVGILSVLPEEYHAQFLIEYAAAVEGARRPEQFRQLQELLRLWRLRAVAYSSPGYDERLAAVRRVTGSSLAAAPSFSFIRCPSTHVMRSSNAPPSWPESPGMRWCGLQELTLGSVRSCSGRAAASCASTSTRMRS